LARITAEPKRKNKPASVDRCPFCLDSPMDSLTHALHECRMDGWQEHCKWAAEAIAVIRERFLVSTMTALLELHCPLNFAAPAKKEPVPRQGRKRATGNLQPIPFSEVQRGKKPGCHARAGYGW
jgi:hypothetical protein